MVDEGTLPVWALIMEAARRRHAPMAAQDVCTACAISVRVGGVGLSVLVGNLARRLEPLCAVGELAQQLLEAELTSGDGPCTEAAGTRLPVLTADLRQADQQARWPLLTAMPHAAPIQAVFAFPMLTGSLVAGSPTDSVAVGVLVLCPAGPRTLSPAEQARAQRFADAALMLLLGLVTYDGDGDGDGDGAVLPFDALTLTAHIHQASGVVAVQLGCSPDQALLRLRAYAFASEEALSQVAGQVLAHTLRFSADRPT